MKTNIITNLITKSVKETASLNSILICRVFLHQPKVPAKLLAMKNVK